MLGFRGNSYRNLLKIVYGSNVSCARLHNYYSRATNQLARFSSSASTTPKKHSPPISVYQYFAITLPIIVGAGAYKHFGINENEDTKLLRSLREKLKDNEFVKERLGGSIIVERKTQEKENTSATITCWIHGPKGTASVEFIPSDQNDPSKFSFLQVTFNDEKDHPYDILQIEHETLLNKNKEQQQIINTGDKPSGSIKDWATIGTSILVGACFGMVLSKLVSTFLGLKGSAVLNKAIVLAEQHPAVKDYLGAPMTYSKKDYSGKITQTLAKFSLKCTGSKDKGTLYVHAFREKPDSDWQFSTLSLSIDWLPKKLNLLKKTK